MAKKATRKKTPPKTASSRRSGPPAKDVSHIIEPLRSLAVPLEGLVLDPRNARKHDDRNIEEIAKSIDRYGQRTPIVVNSNGNVILKGNGTVQALRHRGHKYAAAVPVKDNPSTATGYAVSDNRTAELATWDTDVLPQLLVELAGEGITNVDIGFTDDELTEIVSEAMGGMTSEELSPVNEDSQGRLDQTQPKKPTTCPECGHEF